MSTFPGESLGKYWERIFERDHFTCVYCGFDGRPFDNWMQLSTDHVLPKKSGGRDTLANLVTACFFCNFLASAFTADPSESPDHILVRKRAHILERREEYFTRWVQTVAPLHLDHPLPTLPKLAENAADLAAFEERAQEPNLPFKEAVETTSPPASE